jgi:GNAT superfamily N-acetyltransferase
VPANAILPVGGKAKRRRRGGRSPERINPLGTSAAVEYQIRDARVTDVERITALYDALGTTESGPVRTPLGSNDLLRQLVYLPQAIVLVAEARRAILGAIVLALRPSVRHGGYVATVDLLAVEEGYERSGVIDALVASALRSARNKGCVVVETTRPDEADELALLEGYGFDEAPQRLERTLVATPAAPAPS